MDEESAVMRNILQAIAMGSDSGKAIISLMSGITDNRGHYGTFGDLLLMGGDAKEDVEEERKEKACLRAVDAQVISQEGDIGDLWMFVIDASDGRKIAVSGWAY
jgi:hypothetical protein